MTLRFFKCSFYDFPVTGQHTVIRYQSMVKIRYTCKSHWSLLLIPAILITPMIMVETGWQLKRAPHKYFKLNFTGLTVSSFGIKPHQSLNFFWRKICWQCYVTIQAEATCKKKNSYPRARFHRLKNFNMLSKVLDSLAIVNHIISLIINIINYW